MTNILISEFIDKEKLKEQLINSVWKPNIKTYICRRDREPKRKLLINLEANDINKIVDKTKFKKKKKRKNGKIRTY